MMDFKRRFLIHTVRTRWQIILNVFLINEYKVNLLEYEEETLKEIVEKFIKMERIKKNKLMVKLSVKDFTKHQNW